jgi:hypothetical protein
MLLARVTFSVVALYLLGSCAGKVERSADHANPRVPASHRVLDVGCSTMRPAINPTPVACGSACNPRTCVQDSDCVEGENGRCGLAPTGAGFICSYDECASDKDCPSGSRCECRPTAGSAMPNICTPLSNCSSDSECGTAGYCSPSQYMQWCGGFHACHTADDTCIDDTDCASSSQEGLEETCNFDQNEQHWTCSQGCGPQPK